MRVCTCSYSRSMCGLYHSRTRWICPRHSRFGSPSAANSSMNFFHGDARVGGRLEFLERSPQVVAGDEMVERALGVRGTHARHELQHAEGGELVARIVGPAQHRQQILDVRGLEELEAAVFHERDLALRELDFEHVAVRAGAEQHGLPLERNAGFARRRGSRVQMNSACVGRSSTVTSFGRGPWPRIDSRCLRYWRGASAMSAFAASSTLWLERKFCASVTTSALGRKRSGKPEDVLDRRGAERVDSLRVVADHGDALPVGLERAAGCRPAACSCPGIRRPARDRSAPTPTWRCGPRSSSRASRAAGRRNRARGTATCARRRRAAACRCPLRSASTTNTGVSSVSLSDFCVFTRYE